MAKRRTHEDFVCELDSVYPNEFEVIEKFTGMKKPVLIKHIPCGDTRNRYPYDLLAGRYAKCSNCHQTERMKDSLDSYIKENSLEERYSYNIGTAKFQYEKITFHCNSCDNDFSKEIDMFKQGQHCPYCAGQRTNKKYAQYKIDCLTSVGEFLILNNNKEINAHDSKVKLLHTKCNRETYTTLSYFCVQAPFCGHCRKEELREVKMKTDEQFRKEVLDKFGSSITILTKYKGAHEPVTIVHNNCGNELEFTPNNILTGCFGCKYCSMSIPESIIHDTLKSNNVKFELQYKFDDCISSTWRKVRLPFDFAVFDNNEKLLFIIEYDGQQHTNSDAFGEESFEITVRNDKIKNQYCEENNIDLIRIPYTEYKNLRQKTLEVLNKYKLLKIAK